MQAKPTDMAGPAALRHCLAERPVWHWRYDRDHDRLSLFPPVRLSGDHVALEQSGFMAALATTDTRQFEALIARPDTPGAPSPALILELSGPQCLWLCEPAYADTLGRWAQGLVWTGAGHRSVLPAQVEQVLLGSSEAFGLFALDGTLEWQNDAMARLLGLSKRQAQWAQGRYKLHRDSVLQSAAGLDRLLAAATVTGASQSVTLEYPLAGRRLAISAALVPVFEDHHYPEAWLVHLQPQSLGPSPLGRDWAISGDCRVLLNDGAGYPLAGDEALTRLALSPGQGDPHSQVALQRFRRRARAHSGLFSEPVSLALGDAEADAGRERLGLALPFYGPGGTRLLSAQLFAPRRRIGTAPSREVHGLLNAVSAAILYLDQWGQVREFNEAAAALMGGAARCGRSFIECAARWQDPAETHREAMQVLRTGLAQRGTLESVEVAGRNRWFEVDKVPTRDDNGAVNGVLLTLNEVSDQLRRARDYRDIEARYHAYRANSTDAIWCYEMGSPVDVTAPMDAQVEAIVEGARLSDANEALFGMLGVTDPDRLLGSGLAAMGSQNYLFDIHTFIRGGYRLSDYDIVQTNHRGEQVYRQISCAGVIDQGQLLRVWGSTKDITARKRYEEKLTYQANHDALTELPNRTKLYSDMRDWLQSRRADQQGALMLIDLDRFKEINDTLGHQVGDQLLKQVGPRLESELSGMPSLIARLGGDEFAIFLKRIRNPQQAVVLAHRVLDALGEEFHLDGFSTEMSASIGICLSPGQASDISTMMRYADVAMYRAKKEMSGLSLYSAADDPHSPERLAMMSDLGRAIREDQLTLYYQPKVDLQRGVFVGFEALLRWFHPTMGFVSPGEFIPVVELTSLVHPMTAWVLEQALRQCSQWRADGYRLSVAVNLSARNLLDDNLPQLIARLLDGYQLPGEALDLEITESSIMTDPARALRNLGHLHELGLTLSIDDFGTGYSSLAYLKSLPVGALKIDNSFVRFMLESERDEIIVRSTIQMAHNLGLTVIAEGVESEALRLRLTDMQCDLAQGYHLGRPLSVPQAEQWMAESDWRVERLS